MDNEDDFLKAAATVSSAEKRYKKWKAAALLTWSVAIYNIYSFQVLVAAGYLWIGYEVAANAEEYSFSSPGFYLAMVFWLPLLLYGGLKEVVK